MNQLRFQFGPSGRVHGHAEVGRARIHQIISLAQRSADKEIEILPKDVSDMGHIRWLRFGSITKKPSTQINQSIHINTVFIMQCMSSSAYGERPQTKASKNQPSLRIGLLYCNNVLD